MATDGAVVESPVAPPAGAAPDPKGSSPAGAPPAASQPEYKWEDDTRTRGMQTDLQKERKARQDHEKAVETAKAEADQWRKKALALSGLEPADPKQQDADTIRAKILELMPELGDLGSIADMRQQIEQQQVNGFADHSTRMIGQIHQGIAAEYGELTDRQKRRINAAYLFENETNPEFHARHNQGDPTLVAEFVRDMVEDLVEPIKRKTMASEVRRFPKVPTGKDRSSPLRGEPEAKGDDMLRKHYREHQSR